jgi:hypothetical protein
MRSTRLVPVENLGSKPNFTLACRHYGGPHRGRALLGEKISFLSRLVVFIGIERLSFPCIGSGMGAAVPVKSCRISTLFPDFSPKRSVNASLKEFSGI